LTIRLDPTIVPARDTVASVEFLAADFGVWVKPDQGHFTHALRLGEPAAAPRAFAGFWLLALVGFPAFALAWGYAGAWLRRRIRRSRGPAPGA
jgi:hypothetical protein